VQLVYVQSGLPPAGVLGRIRSTAQSQGVAVEQVTAATLGGLARTDAPQGVVARCDPLPLARLADLTAPAPALVLVLDGVVDPRNLGAAARAAEAMGATGLVVSRHGGSPLSAAAAKAAAGALEHLPVSLVAGIPSTLQRLKRLGLWVVALDPDVGDSVWDMALATEPLALLIGAEGRGVGRLAGEWADAAVRIPTFGHTGSLNAASAAAVALSEVRRLRAKVGK
jgi:23S rRNA (guanosine2251-2'-O)-methyltransferase